MLSLNKDKFAWVKRRPSACLRYISTSHYQEGREREPEYLEKMLLSSAPESVLRVTCVARLLFQGS